MRIIKRDEFLNLPENILYSFYEPVVFNGFMIKTSSLADGWQNDWLYVDLIGSIDTDSSDDFSKKCKQMESGKSMPVDLEASSRNGEFVDEQLFAIYEPEDIKNIISKLKQCLDGELLQTQGG
jgi:hypothetical protein